jgi:hypothetical protein
MVLKNFEVVKLRSFEKSLAKKLSKFANSIFYASSSGEPIEVLHDGELELVTLSQTKHIPFLATDERVLRFLIESPEKLRLLLEERLETKIEINSLSLQRFNSLLSLKPKIIRSLDIVSALLLKGYLKPTGIPFVSKKKALRAYVRGLVYGIKYRGCGVSFEEVKKYADYILERLT